ncbi:2975_t:CDS:2 [Entrophospora sp. SA101]|nr:2975_t:CDS:2 [Entrophospora sp. SA101]
MSSSSWNNDIRVVVCIANPEIVTNETWTGYSGRLKTNTVLQYNDSFEKVVAWGQPALAKRERRGRNNNLNTSKVIAELFKLHLGNVPDHQKTKLPGDLSHKRVISDYLEQIDTVAMRWPGIDFYKNVRLVLTVPAEFNEQAIATMRECAFNAKLINVKNTQNLQFTTEPEAAAIHCMKVLKEHSLTEPGTSYMIVDCGGGTVDLTTRRLMEGDTLGEVTERSGGFCGGSFVDLEFIDFLGKKVGERAIKLLKENHYGQYQYLVQEFCQRIKIPFTGDRKDLDGFELDIDDVCKVLKQYISSDKKDELEDNEWLVEMTFEDIKGTFDPVINKIIKLIKDQLKKSGKCSAMFLVGGFSESKYLQKRIRDEFRSQVNNISVPVQPVAAVVRGGVEYGINMATIKSRVLKKTYGILLMPQFRAGIDPPERKLAHNRIQKFSKVVQRGTEVGVNQEFKRTLKPSYSLQSVFSIPIFITTNDNATYCDEPGMELLGQLQMNLPQQHLGMDRVIEFNMIFGQIELQAYAKNIKTGEVATATFNLKF